MLVYIQIQRVNANDKGWQRGNVATVLVAGDKSLINYVKYINFF